MSIINIIITTYNRDKMLHDLLVDIRREKGEYKIHTQIFDDASSDYAEIKSPGYYYSRVHYGKHGYWALWDKIFGMVIKADYYIVLPDDVRLCKDFFQKAVNLFDGIKDGKKICLSLLSDKRISHPNWGSDKPKNAGDVILTGWNDLCFISTMRFWKELRGINPIPASRWTSDKNRSSGVGEQISYRLRARGFNMYHTTGSLVAHGDHESKMNQDERLIHPLRTL